MEYKLLQNESSSPIKFNHAGKTYKLAGVDADGKPVPVVLAKRVNGQAVTLNKKGEKKLFREVTKGWETYRGQKLGPDEELVKENSVKVPEDVAPILVSLGAAAGVVLKAYRLDSKELSPLVEKLRLEKNELELEKARLQAEKEALMKESSDENRKLTMELQSAREQLEALAATRKEKSKKAD